MLPVVSARKYTSAFGGETGAVTVFSTSSDSPGASVPVTAAGSTPVARAAVPAVSRNAVTSANADEPRRSQVMAIPYSLNPLAPDWNHLPALKVADGTEEGSPEGPGMDCRDANAPCTS